MYIKLIRPIWKKEARKAGMSFGNYVVVQEESLSPLEKNLLMLLKVNWQILIRVMRKGIIL